MPSLYTISQETRMAIDEIMQLENMPDDVINDTLESVKGDLEEKQISVAAYIMNLQGDIAAMKEYESAMKQRRQALEKKVERMKESILTSMQLNNQEAVPSLELTLKRRTNPVRVVIDNDRILPDSMMRIIKEPDKSKLKDALLKGEEILGAHLEQSERLEIK
jgi:hypothetical protein